MWVVAKIKHGELEIFKKELIIKLKAKPIFYVPRIKVEKSKKARTKMYSKSILENYIFCFHENFKSTKLIKQLGFLRGLNFFLEGYKLNQEPIVKFINYCKSFESSDGFIKPSFFLKIISKKAKFISGPFTNMFFDIIEKQKNKLKVIVGDVVTTVPYNKNYLYQPV